MKGIDALDDNLPFVSMFCTEYDLKKRALACSAGARNKHELALFHDEAYITEGGNALIVFCHTVELDHE